MEELGCTSPFGQNHENICTNQEKGKIAMQTSSKDRHESKKCKYPCTFLKIKVIENGKGSLKTSNTWTLTLRFLKYIRVTTSYYSYKELELLAEFGGYIGLFLGVSIFHLKDALKIFFKMFLH